MKLFNLTLINTVLEATPGGPLTEGGCFLLGVVYKRARRVVRNGIIKVVYKQRGWTRYKREPLDPFYTGSATGLYTPFT